MNQLILGLSSDGKGLLVRIKEMSVGSFWHVHSNEMTSYQRQVHKKLVSKNA